MGDLPPILQAAWQTPAGSSVLSPESAHIWRIPLDDASGLRADGDTLSEDELERASRFRFEIDRTRWIASRAALRDILATYLNTAPASIRFSVGEYGKPLLNPDFHAESTIEFNLSHTSNLAVVAVTRSIPVGIDIELAKRDFDPLSVASSVFSPDELSYLKASNGPSCLERFYAVWSIKEAWLKLVGCGLIDDIRHYSIFKPLSCGTPRLPVYLQRIAIDRGFSAALATAEPIFACSFFEFRFSVKV